MSKLPTGAAGSAQGAPFPSGAAPVGAVLAGGVGRRIGGAKAMVALDRRPLISYPLEALWRGLGSVVIVAKPDTELPSVPGVTVWIEPSQPRHPLTGILYALSLAEGRAVVVCAGDMPFVTPALVGALARADPGPAGAVLASAQGEVQPLLGCFQPSTLAPLSQAAHHPEMRLQDVMRTLGARLYEVGDPELLFNVNTPDDLLQAAAMLDRRRARGSSRR